MPGPTSSEDARIARLKTLFGDDAEGVTVGIGDDAAVLQGDARPLACSVDVAVEGVHFERAWLALEDIAFRAFMAAASDLAAMAALPGHALCAWTLPAQLSDAELARLGEGTRRASAQCAMPVVGGNLARASVLTLTTTVFGRLEGAPVLRKGGVAGQSLFVSGPVGGPRLGLAQLAGGQGADDGPYAMAFRAPRARLDLAAELRSAASCALDLSDGLLPDLARLCEASAVGARIELARLPHLAGFEEAATALGLDPHACLLAGGEEYELLFASDAHSLPWATRIGRLEPPDFGVRVLDESGQPCPLPDGFRHF